MTIDRNSTEAIHNALIEGLHYLDGQHADLSTMTAAEILNMHNGAMVRYHSDPLFHARVQMLAGLIIRNLREASP